MKKVKSVSVISCLVLVLAVFFLWSSFAKEAIAQAKTLKIGLISSVTGPMAPAFKSELDAAKPAAARLLCALEKPRRGPGLHRSRVGIHPAGWHAYTDSSRAVEIISRWQLAIFHPTLPRPAFVTRAEPVLGWRMASTVRKRRSMARIKK